MTNLHWRKSSYSGSQGGNCLEVAQLPDGNIAVRDSKRPSDGTLAFTPAEMAAWIKGCKAGEFDDLLTTHRTGADTSGSEHRRSRR